MHQIIACLLTLVFAVSTISSARAQEYTAPADAALSAELKQALSTLEDARIIQDKNEWAKMLATGAFVPAEKAQALLLAGANKFETATTVEDALRVLGARRIIGNVAEWTARFAKKGRFPGKQVSIVIQRLATALSKAAKAPAGTQATP